MINTNRTGIEDAEKQVIKALRAWRAPAIAVLRDPLQGDTTSAPHLLVVLPYAVVVLDVYRVPKRVGGVFRCPAHGDWSLSYQEDGARINHEFGNRLPAVLGLTGALRDAAESAGGSAALVTGRVVVVPWNFPVTLEKVGLPTAEGLDVLLSDPGLSELRRWADEHAQDRPTWTAEQALALLGGFGFGPDHPAKDRRVTLQELIRLGFSPPPPVSPPPPISPPPPVLPPSVLPPPETLVQKAKRWVSAVMTKPQGRQQWLLAGVVAAVWLGIMAVVGPALTPDHGTGTGSVTITTSVPSMTNSTMAPK
ncbi:hypothetical protein ACFXHA_26695 [Nocardia sp. NPDC059240]|uniref:hypothetical protein n=1 Tax=Nocardia sp. NPDC059240 TaxID=3346786 RepID=UPI0036737F11